MFLALFEKMFFCPFAKNEVKAVKVAVLACQLHCATCRPHHVACRPHCAVMPSLAGCCSKADADQRSSGFRFKAKVGLIVTFTFGFKVKILSVSR